LRFKIYLRSDKTMFINLRVGLLSPEKLANSAVPTADLSRAAGPAGRDHSVNGRGLWRTQRCGGERLEQETLNSSQDGLALAAIGSKSADLWDRHYVVFSFGRERVAIHGGALDRPAVLWVVTREPRHPEDFWDAPASS
jgi:hypothetical protein